MWRALKNMYASLQQAERAWNELAPAVGGD